MEKFYFITSFVVADLNMQKQFLTPEIIKYFMKITLMIIYKYNYQTYITESINGHIK